MSELLVFGSLADYPYARNHPTAWTDPSGNEIDRTPPDWCELCLYNSFIAPTLGSERWLVLPVHIIAHVDIVGQGGQSALDQFIRSLDRSSLKGQVANIAFNYGNADAITLGLDIHTKHIVKGCGPTTCCNPKDKSRLLEGGISDLPDVALIGHEFVHVVQQKNQGEDAFYRDYISEWWQWRRRGASGRDAYRCISSEIQGHAMQSVLTAFFSDASRLAIFEYSCCAREEVPQAHVDIVKAGYQRRVTEDTTLCNRRYPIR